MAPADIACRKCVAQMGEPCVNARGLPFVIDGLAASHAERIEDAIACSQAGGHEASAEDFDNAVLDSGLV